MSNPFDPSELLNAPISGELPTEWSNVPPGWWVFDIRDVQFRAHTDKATGQRSTSRVFFDLKCESDDPALELQMGRKVKKTFGLFLTVENATIKVAPDTNIELGALLKAIGQNEAGWVPTKLIGAKVKMHVTHRKGDDGREYEQVKEFVGPYVETK